MTQFYIESVHFTPNPVQFTNFRSSQTGVIGRDLYKRGLALQAKARRSAPKDTGRMAASIRVDYHTSLNPHVVIGAYTSYSYMVHEGTRPHTIQGGVGRLLSFNVGGKIVYARKVNHPGTRPTRFLTRHLAAAVR